MESRSCAVRKNSRNKPRTTDMPGTSVVAVGSEPGRSADTTKAAQIPAMSCAIMVWIARCHLTAPVMRREVVTFPLRLACAQIGEVGEEEKECVICYSAGKKERENCRVTVLHCGVIRREDGRVTLLQCGVKKKLIDHGRDADRMRTRENNSRSAEQRKRTAGLNIAPLTSAKIATLIANAPPKATEM